MAGQTDTVDKHTDLLLPYQCVDLLEEVSWWYEMLVAILRRLISVQQLLVQLLPTCLLISACWLLWFVELMTVTAGLTEVVVVFVDL